MFLLQEAVISYLFCLLKSRLNFDLQLCVVFGIFCSCGVFQMSLLGWRRVFFLFDDPGLVQ